MKVGDLKKTVAKLPDDLDHMELLTVGNHFGERVYDNVGGIGILPMGKDTCIAIISASEIHRLVADGKIEKPEGYIPPPPEPGEEWKQG